MKSYPPLYILRHGETTWNAQGRLQGHFDAPLTERGCAQAARQGKLLATCDVTGHRLISSPQGRALETARIALSGYAQVIEKEPALTEIGLGKFAGRDRNSLIADTQARDGFDLYELAPEGEGFAALRVRCEAFLERIETPAVLVTHGITSRMLRLILLGHNGCDIRQMGGGQGVVFHVEGGRQTQLSEGG